MALKVVVWGTGNVGRPAIRAVAAHRGLELVGVIVADPDKVGVDAGALAGIDTLGIQATDEVRIAEADDVAAGGGTGACCRHRRCLDVIPWSAPSTVGAGTTPVSCSQGLPRR